MMTIMKQAFLFFAAMVPAFASASETDAQKLEFFETKIRPVLVRECYSCHSQEAQASDKLRGSLLLDTREGSALGGDSGPAVVPGDAEKSLILSALRHEDFEMPPKGKLSDAIIADFEKWIADGAVDPRDGSAAVAGRVIDWEGGRSHWAFQSLPATHDANHSIDHFIGASQQALSTSSRPMADARTLIRRAWLDLLGLPPTPDEMRSWLSRLAPDKQPPGTPVDPLVWRELVDYLLERPQYGERWARHWMDVARFAESHGYEQDYNRGNAYHYRDFLIRAFNDDMPYDQFVQWQLAGDELAPDNPLAWMATGFLGAGAFPTQLTETEFESARYDELDDMVSTTGVAFLGLSVGCARCHDHKFDPITAKEYYQLLSTFTSTIRCEKSFDLDPETNDRNRREHEQALLALKAKLSELETAMPKRLAQWIQSTSFEPKLGGDWMPLTGSIDSDANTKYVAQPDGSYLATGSAPAKDRLTFTTTVPAGTTLTSLRVEALADDSLPRRGPGRADNGNFALGNVECFIEAATDVASPIVFTRAATTFEQNDSSLSAQASIDSDPVSGWAIDGQIGKDNAAVFYVDQPVTILPGSKLRIVLSFPHPNSKHSIGRVRLSIAASADAKVHVGNEGPPASVAWQLRSIPTSLVKPDAETAPVRLAELTKLISDAPNQWRETIEWFTRWQSDWQEAHAQLSKLETSGPSIKTATIQVASEGLSPMKHHADDRGYPHFYPEVHFLRRGDVHQKVEPVSPAPLVVLVSKTKPVQWQAISGEQAKPGPSHRRSRLAQWITDPEQGSGALAARVMANRLWQHHFGRGIVGTPNDFGFSGDAPSDPELLDWLASELIKGQWRLKPMHRLIMTSHTYMQSSEVAAPGEQAWWKRQPRRLEAEAIRDSLLAVSGLLDPTMYGPGSMNEAMRRRSVYFFIKRSELIPSMMLFDWPEHLVSIGQRSSTTIAPQALLMMNNPLVRSAAEAMAKTVVSKHEQVEPSIDDAVERAYQLAYQRSPAAQEREIGKQFLTQLLLARGGDAAKSVTIAQGDPASKVPPTVWADYCQMLLSANEFIYVD